MKHSKYYAQKIVELRSRLDSNDVKKLVRNINDHYYEIQIPKRNGSMRTIMVPDEQLKDLQKRIAEIFERAIFLMDKKTQKILTFDKKREKHYEDYKIGSSSYGFEKGKSIVQNAAVHKNGRHFFKADITQFFSSINFYAVYHLIEKAVEINEESFGRMCVSSCQQYDAAAKNCTYMKGKPFSSSSIQGRFNKRYIYLMANIVCQNGVLGTGSPASPAISNLFMRHFDKKIIQSLHLLGGGQQKFQYTRYADDITISSNLPIDVEVKKMVVEQLSNKKLKLNEDKTHFQSYKAKNVITGINCTKDGTLTVGRHKKQAIKKMLYKLVTEPTNEKEFRILNGNLSYMFSVEPSYTLKMINKYHTFGKTLASFLGDKERQDKLTKLDEIFNNMGKKKVGV